MGSALRLISVFIVVLFISTSFNKLEPTFCITLKANNHCVKVGDTVLVKNEKHLLKKMSFYISNLEFYNKGKSIWTDRQKHRLIDFENKCNYSIEHTCQKSFDKISFTLGIDSATNCSGAYGGDLDPTKGMYWSWQSSYINFKCETQSLSNPKNHLTYHLGGYAYPNNAAHKVGVSIEQGDLNGLALDIEGLLNNFYSTGNKKIMSPSANAVALAKRTELFINVAHEGPSK